MTEDSMHRTLDAALVRNSGPSAEDVEAQIAHRLTCNRCRMSWSCGGLSEDDYEAGARIADLLAAHTAAAEARGAERALAERAPRLWARVADVRRYSEMMTDSISVDRVVMARDILAILDGRVEGGA